MAKTISPVDIQKYLSGVDYPCGKQDLINHAKGRSAPNEIVDALNGIPEREYSNSADVSSEMDVNEE